MFHTCVGLEHTRRNLKKQSSLDGVTLLSAWKTLGISALQHFHHESEQKIDSMRKNHILNLPHEEKSVLWFLCFIGVQHSKKMLRNILEMSCNKSPTSCLSGHFVIVHVFVFQRFGVKVSIRVVCFRVSV